jgi:hypothetical protein
VPENLIASGTGESPGRLVGGRLAVPCTSNPEILRGARRVFLLVTRHLSLVTCDEFGCGQRPRWVLSPSPTRVGQAFPLQRPKAARRPEALRREGGGGCECRNLIKDKRAIQMANANSKFQMVYHLPFALCHLNFEFLFSAQKGGRGENVGSRRQGEPRVGQALPLHGATSVGQALPLHGATRVGQALPLQYPDPLAISSCPVQCYHFHGVRRGVRGGVLWRCGNIIARKRTTGCART